MTLELNLSTSGNGTSCVAMILAIVVGMVRNSVEEDAFTSAVNPLSSRCFVWLAPWSLRAEAEAGAGASDQEIEPQPYSFNSRRERNGLFRGCDAGVAEGGQD
jgi:hypothetical protein